MRLANAVSNADARRLLIPSAPAKGNKFNAVKVVNENGKFDSKHEATWAGKLIILRNSGVIKDLKLDKRELKYALDVKGVRVGDYTADASFEVVREFVIETINGPATLQAGALYVCDAKSKATRAVRDYKLRRNLMFALHRINILEL